MLREGLLVAFFLAGLVVLGGMQKWWLQDLLAGMNDATLYFGATALTAITDNAALTYLGSLVEGTSEGFRYALVAGAVFSLNASAADLLQVYQQALANDATYASARASAAAGRERIPQGRAGLLPVVGITGSSVKNDRETSPFNEGATITDELADQAHQIIEQMNADHNVDFQWHIHNLDEN